MSSFCQSGNASDPAAGVSLFHRSDSVLQKVTTMSDKSELKAELERKKQRLAQIREEKKRKEEERKKKRN